MFAQQKGQVTGVIKDAETNETLIGVSIYEEKLQLGTTTDEQGHYELELPFGEHHLRISYVGKPLLPIPQEGRERKSSYFYQVIKIDPYCGR